MRILLALVLCGLLAGVPGSAIAQMSYVTVVTQGSGTTTQAAIYDALRAAVEQVNGAQIAAQTGLAVAEESLTDGNGNTDYASSQSFAQGVASRTKGTIREYRILSQGPDATLADMHAVELKVVVAKYERSAQLDRKRIAIMPFRLDSGIPPHVGETVAETLGQGLISYLTQTRKFAILERNYLEEQQSELGLVASGQTPVEELAKLGQKVSADLILVGTVSDANSRKKTIESKAVGISRTTYVGTLNVAYRIIDAATGQVKWSDSYNASTETDSADGLFQALAASGAEEIGTSVLNAIYPVTVAAMSGEELVLGQGGKTIAVGQRFRLIKLGQVLQDQHTGESLGAEEITVGEIRIVGVTPRQARAVVVTSNIDMAAQFATATFIVRPLSKAARAAAAAQAKAAQVRKVEKEMDAGFDSFEKDNSDEW